MNVWVEAARPRTLSAAVAPVLVGTAASGRFIPSRFAATMTVAVAIQAGVNYANDYFDAAAGVDSPARVGPRRAVSSGLVSPLAMKIAMASAFLVAAVAGLFLALAIGPELIALGALCVAAALGYSGGPRPYASEGLGEVFAFVFFGLVATVGSSYAQAEQVLAPAVAAAVPVGFLATAILVVNNLRDLVSDAAAGKRTLAVRWGSEKTRSLYRALIVSSFLLAVVVVAAAGSAWPLVCLLALPLGAAVIGAVASEQNLVPALGATARLQVAYAGLLSVGLWIS